tara:strand:- start:50 stop:1006 length:957 start_codon:yes stop_codon:yes gene_type:complete
VAKSKTTPTPVPIDRNKAVNVFGNVAQTNHYLVSFSGFGRTGLLGGLSNHLKTKFDVNLNEILANTGIMCNDASLPGSSLATSEVKDNFMGISQEFAHTRLYTDIDFTFYVDSNYNNLRFFEGWIDYIASGSNANEYGTNYYRRMRYPDHYKCSAMSITKFERNMSNTTLSYKFINAFPKTVAAVPVSYGGADILRVSVSFNYDRYIVNPTKDTFLGEVNTFDPDSARASYDPSKERKLIQQRREQSLKGSTPAKPAKPAKPVISERQQEVLDENANRLKVLQETGQGSTPEKRTTSEGREYTVVVDPTFGHEIRTFK